MLRYYERHCLGYSNTHFTLVLPYMKAEYRDNKQNYLNYYDEVEICSESADVYPNSAIQVCNRSIGNRSDLVIRCIQHNSGAYKTIQYAKKQGKKIVILAKNLNKPSEKEKELFSIIREQLFLL